ncbi:hypothetical protein A2U01_0049870 [Trifolium medium]|uniref:Uncharacterized protein n=1 Tax=Trifolium medium TaxID=97028 RepID=A0A392QWJ6_9FABA|nr:hypothetical protein [Trifolium medium]
MGESFSPYLSKSRVISWKSSTIQGTRNKSSRSSFKRAFMESTSESILRGPDGPEAAATLETYEVDEGTMDKRWAILH